MPSPLGENGAIEGQLSRPGAAQRVGDGHAVDGEGVGRGGHRIGRCGMVEGVGGYPVVASAGHCGDVQTGAFGEVEVGVVGPHTHVVKRGVAGDDGGVVIGTSGCVVQEGYVGAFAEAIDEGVAYSVVENVVAQLYRALACFGAQQVVDMLLDFHDGRILDGEGALDTAVVVDDYEGVGTIAGTETRQDGVARYAVPVEKCCAVRLVSEAGYGTSVTASRTGGGNDDKGVEGVDELDDECVGFVASVEGGYLQYIGAGFGDVGVGDAAVGGGASGRGDRGHAGGLEVVPSPKSQRNEVPRPVLVMLTV